MGKRGGDVETCREVERRGGEERRRGEEVERWIHGMGGPIPCLESVPVEPGTGSSARKISPHNFWL